MHNDPTANQADLQKQERVFVWQLIGFTALVCLGGLLFVTIQGRCFSILHGLFGMAGAPAVGYPGGTTAGNIGSAGRSVQANPEFLSYN
jgi:hypothetical protein